MFGKPQKPFNPTSKRHEVSDLKSLLNSFKRGAEMAMIVRTDQLLEQLIYCDFRTEVGVDKARTLIRRALKVQDRETRHACADAVSGCHEVCETPTGGSAIDINDAHNVCMNVKAV